MPDLSVLQTMGVKRISLGPRLMQATMGILFDCAKELKEKGSFTFLDRVAGFGNVESLFAENAADPVDLRQ